MKKRSMLFALVVTVCMGAICMLTTTVSASCYKFKDGDDIQVCVKGDNFKQQKKAKQVCDKLKKSDCGTISKRSSSCYSNVEKCYDEKGKPHRSLKGY